MLFEFIASPNFNFLTSFGEKFNISVADDRLTIPESLDKGYIRRFELGTGFRLLIHHYKLKEEFILKRRGVNNLTDIISIIFNCTEQLIDPTRTSIDNLKFSKNNDFEIQIASTDLDFLIRYPANTESFTL